MTTALTITICKTIIDKYGSPTVQDSEWVNHINIAQQEVLNRLIPDSLNRREAVDLDFDYNTIEEIRPLIFNLTMTPSGGMITNAAILSSLQSASGDSSCDIFRILKFSKASDNTVIKYIKQGNLRSYQNNVFKSPSDSFPYFEAIAGGYQIYPSLGVSINIGAMKTPKQATNTGESLDWSNYVMNQVIFQSVKIASPGIRDSELIMDIRNTGIVSAQ